MEEMEIRKYARLMDELNLTGLEITSDNDRVRLERSAGSGVVQNVVSVPVTEPQSAPAEPAGVFTVSSPMVGIFYAAPDEGGKPYVQVGDAVKQGDVQGSSGARKGRKENHPEKDAVGPE